MMADLYGHRWVSSFGADAGASAGQTWARALGDLTAEQLGIGVSACAQGATVDGWPPTAPEFRALCLEVKPLAFVVDDITRAPRYRHPFTVMVWRRIDGYNFARADQRQAERMLRNAYEAARAARMSGLPLPEPPAGELEAPVPAPPKPSDPATAAAAREAVEAHYSANGEGE